MDGFSVTSLTSLCTSIANRAASSVGELDRLGDARPEAILTLAGHVRHVRRDASQLEQQIGDAAVISQRLQRVLSEALEACDATMGRLHKQVMRLQVDTLSVVDGGYMEAYGHCLATYCRLFAYFGQVLSSNDRTQQDARLDTTEGQEMLEQASIVFRVASTANSILLDGSKFANLAPQPELSGDEPPPSYIAAPASSFSNTAQDGSSSSGILSSLTGSLKAFAANFASRPDPLASALCQAINRGDTSLVSGLLAQGASFTGRNEDGRTPLQCAVAADRDDAVRLLLAAGASSKGSGGQSGSPLLFQAASAGSLRVAQMMLDHGADVGEKNVTGEPYFVGVCDSGNMAGINFLLSNGAKATSRSISGRPVLVQAVSKGNNGLVKLLLDYGAEANCSDITGSSVLAVATAKPDLALAQLLLDYGASPNDTTIWGVSVLADAISNGRLDLARLLLDRGAKGDRADITGQPLLIRVIKDAAITDGDKLDLARRLLENGASTNEGDKTWRRPAICHAMEASQRHIVKLLLEHGAKLSHKMKSGSTLLLHAVDQGWRDEVAAMLEHGADANDGDEQGRTPLMQAVVRQDAAMVKMLKDHGADVNTMAPAGVMDFVRALSRPDMRELLGLEPSASGAPRAGTASAAEAGRPESPPPPGYDATMRT